MDSLHKMINVTIFLMVAMLIFTQYTDGQSCGVDKLIDEKIKASLGPLVSEAMRKSHLVCTDVHSKGRLAICPSGFQVASCSCGMACGSWDIQADKICHCQCAVMDWARARCCKVAT